MARKRGYTKYSPELRQKAFELFMEGKTMMEIKDICSIGDSQGTSRIRREDRWDLKKKTIETQMAIATVERTLPTNVGEDIVEGVASIRENYDAILARRAEVATIAKIIADKAMSFLQEDDLKFKNLAEAWLMFKEATAMERSLMRVSVEESFILKVFEAMKEEITDNDILVRVGERLKLLVLEEQK